MQKKYIFLALLAFSTIFGCTNKDSILPSTPPTQPTTPTVSKPIEKSAADYYVAPTGNDANPGTAEAPFLTIQKAADVAAAGNVILIRDGVYSGGGESLVNISKSGTSDKYITFEAENKGKAILDGGNSTGYGIIISAGASYINIEGLEIRNFQSVGIHSNDSQVSAYINIKGNNIHDIGRVVSSDGIGRCGIYFKMKSHHWTIDKNLIYNIGRVGPDIWWNKDHAVYIGSVDVPSNAAHDNKITSNIIYGCSGTALQISSVNDIVANNVIAWSNENSHSGSPFISVYPVTANLTVANNIFYQPPVGNPFVFGTQYGNSGWVVENNMVYGGRMWETSDSGTNAAMKGNNYGQTDCDRPEADPLFVSAVRANAPNVDFSLQPSSPAINKGIDVGVVSDFFEKPINSTPSIGAIQ